MKGSLEKIVDLLSKLLGSWTSILMVVTAPDQRICPLVGY